MSAVDRETRRDAFARDLPYRELRSVFEKQKATVFMPYDEYLKLIAKDSMPKPGQPPVAAVISAATYRTTIDRDVARIEAEYTVRVLGQAWSELPVKFGNAAVGEVTSELIGDAKADKILLRASGDGTYSLLFPTPGEYKVKIQLGSSSDTSSEVVSGDLKIGDSIILNPPAASFGGPPGGGRPGSSAGGG